MNGDGKLEVIVQSFATRATGIPSTAANLTRSKPYWLSNVEREAAGSSAGAQPSCQRQIRCPKQEPSLIKRL